MTQAVFGPGAVIYAVNRQRLQTLAEFQAALKGAGAGNAVAVSLLRGDFNITITVR